MIQHSPVEEDERRYCMDLPSLPPLMWVEHKAQIGGSNLSLIAFGAYNALGLIGPEKGGLAVVCEAPRSVVGTIDLPYSMQGRSALFNEGFEGATARIDKPGELGQWLAAQGFDLRPDPMDFLWLVKPLDTSTQKDPAP